MQDDTRSRQQTTPQTSERPDADSHAESYAESYDEAFDGRTPRPAYRRLLDRLDGADLDALTVEVNALLAERGVRFGGEEGHEFRVDPLPRVLSGEEWARIEAGVAQRVRALDALVADAYGERRLVADGVLPEAVLTGSSYFEEDVIGMRPVGGAWISVAGLDLVRGSDGGFRVLEDNVRTPSGLGYAMAASDAVAEVLGVRPAREDVRSELGAALSRALEAAAPALDGELVLLTDGTSNSASYEHGRLAELAGLVLVTPADLRRSGDRLLLTDGRPVRSVYRRTDDDRVRTSSGALTPVAELLLEPLRAGSVGLANWFGAGVADDKFVYAFVDEVVRHLPGEEPVLPAVPTYDLRDPRQHAAALERAGELVLKPRDGSGGQGVVVGPTASPAELDSAVAGLRAAPEDWIVQELVALSTVPVVTDGRLAPRHCDLRPFGVFDGRDVVVPLGGLTRVALDEGSMVVNSSRRGGAKATWVG
ncbi:MAG TPA: circularly permuted type 2 ATP-grasp protein [Nocardioides sp.]|uniref:circularly permuted type 2 ATP-grasp protein n=1 Tax=Nocardioides sp. TaxID=35761 RepID=UPI002C9389E7|nr:circularly permuted type 2 ATP-grasp protein [Nocardioides sp.]HTW16316.1 circularly permuted type 2 ATP-grasp protein [Nocardioides sp.]